MAASIGVHASSGASLLRPPRTRPNRTPVRPSPTLFDRLRDDVPAYAAEVAGSSIGDLRDSVGRDLGLLLNTTNAEGLVDRSRHAHAAASTINYGIAPLAGMHATERKWGDVERVIRRAIADYEPRLIPDSVSITPLAAAGSGGAHNLLRFEIRALIRFEPSPVEFAVQSSVDLETNRMQILQSTHGPAQAVRPR